MQYKIAVVLCLYFALAAAKPGRGKGLRSVEQKSLEVLNHSIDTDLLERGVAVLKATNCSIGAVTKFVEKIYLYSAHFVVEATDIVTKIGLHFTGCALDIIPGKVIKCVISGILELPAEIGSIIEASLNYFSNIISLIPPFIGDIESCFTNGMNDYRKTVKGRIH